MVAVPCKTIGLERCQITEVSLYHSILCSVKDYIRPCAYVRSLRVHLDVFLLCCAEDSCGYIIVPNSWFV